MCVHRANPKKAVHHECDRFSIRRIERAVFTACAQRLKRRGLGEGLFARREVYRQDLTGAFAEATRVGFERSDGDGFSIGRPAGF
jgi:hypothetical protein